jgi:myo-inositol-1(or 4)-monophosphatase
MKDFLTRIITEAGEISLDYKRRLKDLVINRKSAKDLVTAADVAVERYLVEQIQAACPGHGILGEESGVHPGGEYRWIIDPIDGTTSFVHDQPFYGVSVALEYRGQLVLGAVNAPALGELFVAEVDNGATLNGRPIAVSEREELGDAVLGTGFACTRDNLEHNNLEYLGRVLPQIRDLRRYGSAAVDLAYVACGRLDGFWELNLKLYDVAAGVVLVREAGGIVTDFSGGTGRMPGEIVAANPHLHATLRAALTGHQ